MLKQLILMLVLSAIAAYFLKEFASILQALGQAQNYLAYEISRALPAREISKLISNVIAIIIMPFLLGFIPAFIYWLFERKEMPRLSTFIWVVWLILLLVFALTR